ncbi:DNA topoisomerase II, partial [Perkinsela sp. CCAP 1560/4]
MSSNTNRKKTIEETYQKKTQLEHIVARPDMYIGSCERITEEAWVFDSVLGRMVQRKCSWIPGLYKIFDEILVNSADNKIRDPKGQTCVRVDIEKDSGKISVQNNGEGIPVQMHKEHNIWIPEMIFGHLLTSSNYDDSEAKVTGGRNGFGAKLTNVFSQKFIAETLHHKSKKRFRMTWKKNMEQHSEPEITPVSASEEDFTKVTFWPDFAKFGMTGMEDDIYDIMCRRVIDLAGVSDSSMSVYLNGEKVQVDSFQSYMNLYPTFGEESNEKNFCVVNSRWQVGIRISNIGFQQVSFVNSIATTRGGNHVNYVVGQIVDKVVEQAKKKAKGSEVKSYMVKPHIFVFINCLISNPSFDSQTKETLNTTKSNFGSHCSLPNSMIDHLLKSGLLDRSVETANSKLTKQMAAKSKASVGRVIGIPKLEDANDAGGRNSESCTLILTEGDSAKALAVGGLGTIGRDKFGVFPLRGKPLNVRDAGIKKVGACQEIQDVMKILGLQIGKTYTSTEGLRYGHLMVMSDQDQDGSHIKGLIVNFIHHFWPSLTKIPGFMTQFITPIVKAFHKRTKEVKSFFALNAYLEWRREMSDEESKQWSIKYYKGLGTSTSAEGKEYFTNLNKHKITFQYEHDGADDRQIILAFSKDKIDDRKQWIQDYKASDQEQVDYRVKQIRYKDFIDKELIQFSIADCERSIPSVVDGFKPGQRKIMFSCFKRNLIKSIKVAQLTGYVSEHAAYHHGEQSLQSTIIGLAQDFVGSNNIPLLVPDGQFGTRLQGGKDSASARYIFTRLQKITRSIYRREDDEVLDYKDDDGFPVEPHYYVPVIPMVLVNGTAGIGTGFATNIPNYSPWDVIENLKRLMAGESLTPMKPWYHGFLGEIVEKEKDKFASIGKFNVVNEMLVQIRELPIGYWTHHYKQKLEELMANDLVLNFREYHTDTTVDFDIIFHPEVLRTWRAKGVLADRLDLRSSIPATNLMCFDEAGQLKKFSDAEAILKAFYIIRLDCYGKRKAHMLAKLRQLFEKLQNMVRFIREVNDGTLIISKKKKPVLLEEIKSKGYAAFPPEKGQTKSPAAAEDDDESENKDQEGSLFEVNEGDTGDADSPQTAQRSRDYDYLLGMRIWSLTIERAVALERQADATANEIRKLEAKTPKDLWAEDLNVVKSNLLEFYAAKEKEGIDAKRKLKARQPFDTKRLRIPQLSDTARRAIKKDAGGSLDANPPKVKAQPKSIDSDDESEDWNRRAPAKRKAPTKKTAEKAPAAKKTTSVATKEKPVKKARSKKQGSSSEESFDDAT